MVTFDSTKTELRKLLDEIVEGEIQLPDFQRGWVWDDEHNRVCTTCGCKLTWEDFTIDHIDPHSKGGRSRLDNAALMCRKHNSQKGNRRQNLRG